MTERPTLKGIRREIERQNTTTPLFTEDTPERVAQMIIEEAQELKEELIEAMITADLAKVAGEMGDILYLLIKLEQLTGIDVIKAAQFKIDRNEEKYGGVTDRAEARKSWEAKGGDAAWMERRYYGTRTTRTRRSQLIYQNGAKQPTSGSQPEERANGAGGVVLQEAASSAAD